MSNICTGQVLTEFPNETALVSREISMLRCLWLRAILMRPVIAVAGQLSEPTFPLSIFSNVSPGLHNAIGSLNVRSV